MPRSKTKKAGRPAKASRRRVHDDEEFEEQDLPSDEAGRLKIKRTYEELLGVRIEKLKGQVLNREKINKTIEGIYFICAVCKKVCHSLDEGIIEDPQNENNLCKACGKEKGIRGTAA